MSGTPYPESFFTPFGWLPPSDAGDSATAGHIPVSEDLPTPILSTLTPPRHQMPHDTVAAPGPPGAAVGSPDRAASASGGGASEISRSSVDKPRPRLSLDGIPDGAGLYQLVDEEDAAASAVAEINTVLNTVALRIVGIDLEGDLQPRGTMSLVQVKVEGLPVFIFDVYQCPSMLQAGGVLRSLLESPAVKIIHDQTADSAGLLGQFGIRLEKVFDTQAVDQLIRQNYSQRRGLNSVLQQYLRLENDLKHVIKHRPGLWEKRPLSHKLLRYAAQDTDFLPQLYTALADGMDEQGITMEQALLAQSLVAERRGPSPKKKAQLVKAAALEFKAYILQEDEVRSRCADRSMLKQEFMRWRTDILSEAVSGLSFGAAMYHLRSSLQKVPQGGNREVVIWKKDARAGSFQGREKIALSVKQQRTAFEKDRFGLQVTPTQLFPEEVMRAGEEQTKSITIRNNSQSSVWFRGAEWLHGGGGSSQLAVSGGPSRARALELLPSKKTTLKVKATILNTVARDVLELQFSKTSAAEAGDCFSVARYVTLRGSANPELIRALKPTAPYKRKKKAPELATRRGPAGTPVKNKPWPIQPREEYTLPRDLKYRVAEEEVDLEAPVTFETYSSQFELLLWMEEQAVREAMRTFDQPSSRLTAVGGGRLLQLFVPGLAESRPSVLRGDTVLATQQGSKTTFPGIAHIVELDTVQLSFHDKFRRAFASNPAAKVNIRFTVKRTNFLLQQIATHNLDVSFLPILFPSPSAAAAEPGSPPAPPSWKNRHLNDLQKQAVQYALLDDPRPYVVFGPPGTGKTTTVIEIILQLLHNTEGRILVTAPSNTACDLLCLRLAKRGATFMNMLRDMAYSRTVAAADSQILKYCMAQDGNFFTAATLKDLLKRRIVVATLAKAAKYPFSHAMPPGTFTHVVVDEAGHAPEPEVLAAIRSGWVPGNGGRVVLAGDPKQLGPILQSNRAVEFGLGISMLERLCATPAFSPRPSGCYDPQVLTMLVENYRSHPLLLEVPNRLFYGGALVSRADRALVDSLLRWEHLPKPGTPMLFHGVEGKDEREGDSPSWFNADEVAQVVEYVKLLLEGSRGIAVRARDIGVIAPYHKQVLKIRQGLRIGLPSQDTREIMVGSTEQFQGQERKVIIISTVRSRREHVAADVKFSLGFVASAKRFNVAITRAQALLIVVGNPHLLAADDNWKALLGKCAELGATAGEPIPADEASPRLQDLEDAIARLSVEEVDVEAKPLLREE